MELVKWFEDLSIKNKVVAATVFISTVTLALTITVMTIFESLTVPQPVGQGPGTSGTGVGTPLGIGLVLLLASAVLALVLSQVLARRIIRPIDVLSRTVDKVSESRDLSLRAPQLGEDEVGKLAAAFNQMLDRLQKAESQISESQARFAGIIESAMDAIISVDLHQRITIFNAAAERMFGCSAQAALGQPLDRFIPARFREAHRHDIEQFGRTGTTTRTMGHLRPLSGLRANGQEFPIEAAISQAEIGGDRIYTVIVRDITERERVRQRIEQMNQELEERVETRTAELTTANRELEAFTYSVAHDLRAPLRHIDAFSKILSEDYAPALSEEARGFLESISRGTRHMSQLVDDLLNLARVARQQMKREPTPLRPLVEEVIADLKSETSQRSIDWRVRALPSIDCDRGLMKQVLTNLLSNAVKYTRPREQAVIEIGSLNGGPMIFVRDNGVGFNMKYADKLFGVFQRLHRNDEFEGTGVGLATVERIVRKHGGCVWAESAVNKGAVFYFSVPPSKTAESPKNQATEAG